MFNVSSEFKNAIKNDSREFKSKVLIGEEEYSDDKIINFSLESSMAPSDEFSLGAVVASKFEMSIALNDVRNNKIIKPFIGLKVGSNFEYVPLGVFNIEEKSIKNGLVNLSCFDNVGKLEKPYFSDLSYPATLQSVAIEICKKANITFSSTLPNLKINKKIDGYTCREALSFIASACGGFAIANRTGAIEIKNAVGSTSSITGNNYFTFENDDAFTIKKVTAHIDDKTTISRGTGIGIEEIEFKNPFATDSILDYVYSKIKDYKYIPGTLVWQGNPALDLGEKLTITDISGINHEILIMRNKIVYEGGLRGETNSLAKSLGKSNFNYGGSMQGAVDRVTAEQIVVKELLADKANIGQLNAINANIENLTVTKADIEDLTATNANIENLIATKANITDLNATNATITNLQATKADIVDLNAANGKITILESESAKIGVLEGNVAKIQDVVSGNISSDNIQSGGITGDRLNMSTIFVNDANIININASKVNAGEIDTSKVKVKSADGAIEIAGATQQFKDKNNKVRIQMGKDTQGNFNFILRGEDGTSTLIDHTGIKEKAITDNLIKDTMIAPDAVGEKQINYNSFSTGFNKDTNTTQIKATKVRLDNQNQSLDVGFTSLKNQADGTKIQTESNTTSINVQQGQINTAIANTKIVKDGKEILLKDDYNTTVTTIDSMKNTISSHTTKIDANTGKIGTVESKTNVLERDLNSMSSKITATETTVNTHTTQINTATTNASTAQNTANAAVNKADKAQNDATSANNKVDNLEIGGRNYIILKNLSSYAPYNSVVNENGIIKLKMISNSYITLSISGFIPKNKKYTISGIAKLNGKVITKDFFKNNKANTYNSGISIIFVKDDGSFKITETWVGNSSWLFHCNTTAVNDDVITFEKLKFEEGEKNTDFTPAPEDVQGGIDKNKNDIITVNTEVTTTKNKISGIEQNLDNITTRVGSVESTTTTHTATINSHTSSLNAVDGKINTAKNQAITGSRQLLDTRSTNENPQWYFINYPRQTITEFKHSDVVQISGSRVYGTLETKVPWNDNSGGYPVQTFRSNGKATFERKGTSNAAWGNWIQIEDTLGSQNKAAQALNDSKGYTNAEVTKVNSTMTSKFAEIKTTTDSITQSVNSTNREVETVKVNVTNAQNSASSANTKIDGLELGGRNLLPKNSLALSNGATGSFDASSNTWNLSATPGSTSWGRGLYIKTPHSIIIPYGKCAIYSFELKVSKQINWNTDVNNGPVSGSAWASNDNDETTLRKTSSKTIVKVNEWVKCWSCISNTSSKNTLKVDIKDISSTFGIVTTNESSNINFQIRNFKVELGNKPTDFTSAPEDVSKEILDITTEKVNQAKADIKITTDAISSKVSQVESTTNTINGKVTAHESRLTSAEQKITPNAIINTVQNTVNQAKNEAINSANSSTDGKLNSYVTKSVFTQTNDQFDFVLQNTGNENLFPNSSFENEEEFNKNHNFTLDRISGALSGYPKPFKDGYYLRLYSNGGDSYFVKKTAIGITPNTNYVFSVYYAASVNCNSSCYLTINGNLQHMKFSFIGDRVWRRAIFKFRTPANVDGINAIRIGAIFPNSQSWILFDDCQFERECLSPWKSHKDELYSGLTRIDRNGVNVFNGALSIFNNAKERVFYADNQGNLNISAVLNAPRVNGRLFSDNGIAITTPNVNNIVFHRSGGDNGYISQITQNNLFIGHYLEFEYGGGKQTIFHTTARPSVAAGGNIDLGSGGARWRNIYATNGTIQTSDRTEKKNINYINSHTKDQKEFDGNEFYDFIKQLNFATWEWNNESLNELNTNLGFIAQDIEASKIGNVILCKKEGVLGYSTSNYINVIGLALKESISKIEVLENNNKLLENRIENLEKVLNELGGLYGR